MAALVALLANNELLLLFATVLCGLLLGRLEWRGMKLGVAGVLFAGLGFSALLPSPGHEFRIATQVKELGLVLFVYCVGLTSAPGFFAAFKSRGLRFNAVVLASLVGAALLCWCGGRVLGFNRGQVAGIFSGALTNTPALGAAADKLVGTQFAIDPVLAYSITYPFGVLGGLLCFRAFWAVAQKRRREHPSEVELLTRPPIRSQTCRVTNPEVGGHAIGELKIRDKMGVVVSRVRRGTETLVPTKYTRLEVLDLVTIVGAEPAVAKAITFFGEASLEHLDDQRDRVDMRRILVSKRAFAGLRLGEVELEERFNAQVTRLRRADVDLVPTAEFRLELGDRLRVVAPRENLGAIAQYFGDSERELAAVDFVSLTLGLCAGLLLAKFPIPLFGAHVELGIAGGPLLAALALGRVGRTGPIAWSMPHETNTVLRDLGLLLFLAGVGVAAGGQIGKVFNADGLVIFAFGALVTVVTTVSVLLLLQFWGKEGVISTLGATSGTQTQPATLAAAYEMSGRHEEIYVFYALTYPVAMIAKILLAQLLALLA